jgi:hypothetical protein
VVFRVLAQRRREGKGEKMDSDALPNHLIDFTPFLASIFRLEVVCEGLKRMQLFFLSLNPKRG